jgi:hypothetical protein
MRKTEVALISRRVRELDARASVTELRASGRAGRLAWRSGENSIEEETLSMTTKPLAGERAARPADALRSVVEASRPGHRLCGRGRAGRAGRIRRRSQTAETQE